MPWSTEFVLVYTINAKMVKWGKWCVVSVLVWATLFSFISLAQKKIDISLS